MKPLFYFNRIVIGSTIFLVCFLASAQIDPVRRNLLELGYDQPLTGQGPQALYAYYYFNNPEFIQTNMALRLAIATAYVDGRKLTSRDTAGRASTRLLESKQAASTSPSA